MSQLFTDVSHALRDAYALERELGEGGMACVFLARELKHDRLVALKVLKPELANAIGSDRFLREIRVMAHLTHPNIVPLFDSGNVNGILYFTMPVMHGETLSRRLAREGQLPVGEAIRIARDIASALAAAHASGIIHRDIKPDNVMFEGENAVVADFGVAAVVQDAGGERLTWSGTSVGTPLYMSPEQALGVDKVDARSDIYSLGCMLYEMLAGEPPFVGGSAQNILVKRLTDPVPSARRLRSTVPEWLDEVVQRSMQRAAADRFPTVDEFIRTLGAPYDGEAPHRPSDPAVMIVPAPARWPTPTPTPPATVTAATTAPAVAVPALAPTPRTARRRLWIGGAVVTAMVAGVLVFRWPLSAAGADPFRATELRPITNEPGPELYPSLRHDGAKVVYTRNGDLYLRDVIEGAEVRLTRHPEFDNRQPSFGPDGRIAFRSERDGGGIFVTDTSGSEKMSRVTDRGFNPTWSPNGKLLLYASESVDEPSTRRGISNLFTADVQTGEQQQISEIDAVQPSWSPNGERIAFWSVMKDGKLSGQRDLWTIAADGSDAVQLTNDLAVDWNPVWTADGTYLLFASNRGGAMSIWRIPVDQRTGRARGQPEPVTTGGASSHGHITVAANGSRAMYTERLTTSNIYKVELDHKRGQTIGTPVPITTGTRLATEPAVSPDGSRVVFYTLSNVMALWLVGSDGTGLRRLTSENDKAKYRSPQWSPDGRTIAFHSDRGGNYQIWTTDSSAKDFTQLTRTGTVTLYPFWSPTGDRVGYVDLGRGVSSVSFKNPKAGSQMLLAGDLMVRPGWSPDGRRIVGTLPPAAGGSGIVMYTPDSRALDKVSPFGDAPQWLPDSRHIVFVWRDTLYYEDIETRKTRALLSFQHDQLALGSVTRDGRWLYFSRAITEADLWSVEPKR